MIESSAAELIDAVQKYFDLMYDCDVSRFEEVFRSTAQLHGFRNGQLVMWPAEQYKDIMANRQSPKSQGALRVDEVRLIDFASDAQAVVKVRVRIGATRFIDHLSYYREGGSWLITSKAYHIDAAVD